MGKSDTSNVESADNYNHVIIRTGKHRIIRCNGDIQWIVQRDQRRDTLQRNARPWVSIAYLLNERFLASVISRPSLEIPSDDVAALTKNWREEGQTNG